MRKVIAAALILVMILSLSACGETATVTKDGKKITAGTIEELEELIDKDLEETFAGLQGEFETLMSEIDTYDKYIENIGKVESFYGRILSETQVMDIRLREYSICYTEIVMKSGGSYEDRYDAIGDMYDLIYDDACGEVYDAVYDDLLGEMYDLIYRGVVKDGYDDAPYEAWYDTSSEAYDMWADCKSDVYDEWSDAKSDIYDFWSDVYGHVYDDDREKINEEIADFREDIEKLKSGE